MNPLKEVDIEESLEYCKCSFLSRKLHGVKRKRTGWYGLTQVFWDYCKKCGGRRDGTIFVR